MRRLADAVARPLEVEQAFSTSAALTRYCANRDGEAKAAIMVRKRAWSNLFWLD